MIEPTTPAGRALLADWSGRFDSWELPDVAAAVASIEAEARRQERDRILPLAFDLPIGEDVNYSRGYSAAIAMIRELSVEP